MPTALVLEKIYLNVRQAAGPVDWLEYIRGTMNRPGGLFYNLCLPNRNVVLIVRVDLSVLLGREA